MKKCIVYGCVNTSDKGGFVGDMCSPCHMMITTGKSSQPSTNFIHKLYNMLEDCDPCSGCNAGCCKCPCEMKKEYDELIK